VLKPDDIVQTLGLLLVLTFALLAYFGQVLHAETFADRRLYRLDFAVVSQLDQTVDLLAQIMVLGSLGRNL